MWPTSPGPYRTTTCRERELTLNHIHIFDHIRTWRPSPDEWSAQCWDHHIPCTKSHHFDLEILFVVSVRLRQFIRYLKLLLISFLVAFSILVRASIYIDRCNEIMSFGGCICIISSFYRWLSNTCPTVGRIYLIYTVRCCCYFTTAIYYSYCQRPSPSVDGW